jgi:hypothetical protein
MLMLALLIAQTIPVVDTPAATYASEAEPVPGYRDHTAEFDRFVSETATLPMEERVRRFRQRFNALFPGFYAPRGGTDDATYDGYVAKALTAYPAIRDKYLATAREFGRTYQTSLARFRGFFPSFAPSIPIYLVHSLGEMDGGTREIGGKEMMVFGADVIARIHDSATIGPFFDHELFHIYHGQRFKDCGQLWCTLWIEGLAVYVAARMNPQASDTALLLTQPRPIRTEIDARLPQAVCFTRSRLDSTAREDFRTFFMGGAAESGFPPRFGYYIGYRVAQKLGEARSLDALARLSPEQVKPLMLQALGELSTC